LKRFLITGGAGYLGSVLVGRLLSREYGVTVVDSLLYSQQSLLQYSGHPAFEFVRGDARDERVLAPLVSRHDVLIPLAAIVGSPGCARDPVTARSVNLEAVRLLNRLRSVDQPVILPSSNSGYGTKSGEMYCTEESPLEPVSLYGITKVEAEQEVLSRPGAISLRLATVFGPSARLRLDLLVNDFVHRAIRDGFLVIYEQHFKRNYIHVEDVAECFLHCIERFDALEGEVYNVGLNEANLSKAELAAKIQEHVPSLYVHYAPVGSDPDRRNYIVSNAKINRTGFCARRTLDEGIRQLLTACRMLPISRFQNA
jgi:nucleoside-diphosphate-sugar epimerase